VAETTVKRLLCWGFDSLIKRRDKRINDGGNMSRNKCFFPGSNVLRFICFMHFMFYVLNQFVSYLLTLPRVRY
jgi:hypothetical protein